MKFLKVAALAAIVSLVVAGFTSKPRLAVTYYYKSGTDYQRLEWGHTTELDLRERTITSDYFTDANNWTMNTQSYIPTTDTTKYIGAISFIEEVLPDGGSDGQLTLQEALNGVWAGYNSTSTMRLSYVVDGNSTVSVDIAATCH